MIFIPLAVAVPLGGAFLIALVGRRPRWFADVLANATAAALVVFSFLLPRQGITVYPVGGWRIEAGVPPGILMVVDGLSWLVALTVAIVTLAVTVYSVAYMRRYTAKPKYYALLLLMVAGMNGAVLTGDIFNLFVFLEVASIASYALVAFGTERDELEAAFKYAILGSVGSLCILLGVALVYGLFGTVNMAQVATRLRAPEAAAKMGAAHLALALFVAGFGLKAALVPFHAWLPDAHPSAPAPVSAMLSGVLIKTIGVYALARIVLHVFGLDPKIRTVVFILAAASMLGAAIASTTQRDLKRLLAYSSISQVGYIVFGLALGNAMGTLGAVLHIFNHATMKSLLFLASGSVEQATGTRDLDRLGGLAGRMPVTAGTTTIGALGIAGIPPFSGFWSKLLIVIAAVQAEEIAMACIAVAASLITLGAFLGMLRRAFFGPETAAARDAREAPAWMCLPIVALAAICLTGGLLLLPQVRDQVLGPAVDAVRQGATYADAILRGGR
ncbi:MAG: NADH/ubiquinone/plastoquinone (complex I) [Planctomycetes bacterium]|nr:NADH/ubiquinone/plastoquinone (complex I) [Planctomycetota bacterium]